MSYQTLSYLPESGTLRLLDQRELPGKTLYQEYQSAADIAQAIRQMVVRGAPAIGATAAYGMAVAAHHSPAESLADLRRDLAAADALLRQSRPTAVNLFWALDQVAALAAAEHWPNAQALRAAITDLAARIAAEDVAINQAIGRHALPLIPQSARIIHHCNTGSLATVDYGTALGVIRSAHEAGRQVEVLVDETRPRLQGARLTAWELQQQGIPYRIIADGASGHFMRRVGVDLCVVGADRIAANGDTANKIGTYNLAVVAQANKVPFYVAAPLSTIDLNTPTGDAIDIEEREATELTHIGGVAVAPEGAAVGNPAFDVTPAAYISAIFTEKGVVYPPYEENLRRLFEV